MLSRFLEVLRGQRVLELGYLASELVASSLSFNITDFFPSAMRACRDAGLVGVAWCGDGAPRKGSGGDPSGIPVSGHAIVVAASGGGCMESWTTPDPGHLAAWQPSKLASFYF